MRSEKFVLFDSHFSVVVRSDIFYEIIFQIEFDGVCRHFIF